MIIYCLGASKWIGVTKKKIFLISSLRCSCPKSNLCCTLRGFFNISSKWATGFHRWAKRFELNFFMHVSFPIHVYGQTRQAKSLSQLVNMPGAWTIMKPCRAHSVMSLRLCCICFCSDREISQYLLQLVQVNKFLEPSLKVEILMNICIVNAYLYRDCTLPSRPSLAQRDLMMMM